MAWPTTVRSKFEEAIEWLKKAEANPDPSASLTAQLFDSMSHFRSGRHDEGRKLLAVAVKRIDSDRPKAGVQRITGGYENGLICQIARREAEKLMK